MLVGIFVGKMLIKVFVVNCSVLFLITARSLISIFVSGFFYSLDMSCSFTFLELSPLNPDVKVCSSVVQ